MAAAPLDAWVRLVMTRGAKIGLRYWPRVGVNLVLSACVTVITLPERLVLAPILWWRGRRSEWRLGGAAAPAVHSQGLVDTSHASGGGGESPPALVVLGYYRTGTTHLHNLLACDPASHTPRWGQVLAPQGFVLSWFVLRLFLTAVLPTRRPQDDMAFGPEWPGEDDFALSNWTLASPLAGRVILPQSYEHFRRFHDLERLTSRERHRWRRTQWAILWKIGLLGRGRRLLLKTPPHTARLPALTDVLGGAGRVKFIHLSREPGAVLKSNERLMKAMTPFHLQESPADEVIRDRLIEEYSDTERRFLRDAMAIPEGDLVRLRYQDVIADPVGELRRAYDGLRLAWTPEFERRLRVYLESVREYRSETQKLASKPTALPLTEEDVSADLRWMIGAFGHDKPTRPAPVASDHSTDRAASSTATQASARPRQLARIFSDFTPVFVAFAGMGLWWLTAWLLGNRHEIATFLIGIAIGHFATHRRSGSIKLGLICVNFSLMVTYLGVMGATRLVDFAGPNPSTSDFRATFLRHLTHESTLLWAILGMVSAYRLGSRRFGAVPGR